MQQNVAATAAVKTTEPPQHICNKSIPKRGTGIENWPSDVWLTVWVQFYCKNRVFSPSICVRNDDSLKKLCKVKEHPTAAEWEKGCIAYLTATRKISTTQQNEQKTNTRNLDAFCSSVCVCRMKDRDGKPLKHEPPFDKPKWDTPFHVAIHTDDTCVIRKLHQFENNNSNNNKNGE